MPTKRFGPRYGRKLRTKVAQIEKQYKNKQKCPYCQKISVKRIAVGIWYCNKCQTKFAGKAYTI